MAHVGFVGLGAMGSAMARRLMAAGHTVHVWNRSSAAVDELTAEGAVPAKDLSDILSTGMAFSMLANDRAVTSLFTPEALNAAPPGAMHVNMATVGIETADALARLHTEAGVGYLAAPVLGRPDVAAAGQLNIVVSGDQETVERARPFLDAMAKEVWLVGERARDANIVKLAVNFNLIHAIQALAESVTLIEAAGLQATRFVDLLTDTAFTGSAYKGYGKLIAEKNYAPAFAVALGAKDLDLVAQAADAHGLVLPSMSTLQRMFAAALASPELAELDWSAIAQVTRMQGTACRAAATGPAAVSPVHNTE